MHRELSLNEQRRKKCQEDYAHTQGKINWHWPTPPPDAGSPTQLLPGDSDTQPPDASSDTQLLPGDSST